MVQFFLWCEGNLDVSKLNHLSLPQAQGRKEGRNTVNDWVKPWNCIHSGRARSHRFHDFLTKSQWGKREKGMGYIPSFPVEYEYMASTSLTSHLFNQYNFHITHVVTSHSYAKQMLGGWKRSSTLGGVLEFVLEMVPWNSILFRYLRSYCIIMKNYT